MRKAIICVVVAVLFFSGCAYNKQTLLKIKGDEVNVPLGPLEGIKGTGLVGVLYRQVSIAFPAGKAMQSFKNLKATDECGDNASPGSVDILP